MLNLHTWFRAYQFHSYIAFSSFIHGKRSLDASFRSPRSNDPLCSSIIRHNVEKRQCQIDPLAMIRSCIIFHFDLAEYKIKNRRCYFVCNVRATRVLDDDCYLFIYLFIRYLYGIDVSINNCLN